MPSASTGKAATEMWTVRLECSTAATPFICRFDAKAVTEMAACLDAQRQAALVGFSVHGIVSVERQKERAA